MIFIFIFIFIFILILISVILIPRKTTKIVLNQYCCFADIYKIKRFDIEFPNKKSINTSNILFEKNWFIVEYKYDDILESGLYLFDYKKTGNDKYYIIEKEPTHKLFRHYQLVDNPGNLKVIGYCVGKLVKVNENRYKLCLIS